MAGLFAHELIAKLVLKKVSKRAFISRYENVDDYFFGAIAPDIRYINNSPREITHRSKGKNSIFESLEKSSTSMPFMAGYETHLIVDNTWSNDNKTMEKSIYEHYGLDAGNPLHKFSLYLLADDYFQGESGWFFQFESAGNVLRANDVSVLQNLGFSLNNILRYKSAAAFYLREPGIDTFNIFNLLPNNFDETIIRKISDQISDQKTSLTSFLKDFKKISIENCVEALGRYL
ncbi:MAG: hypothetical protein ABH854_00950 [Candidatus Diapherotrites archaeon]